MMRDFVTFHWCEEATKLADFSQPVLIAQRVKLDRPSEDNRIFRPPANAQSFDTEYLES